MNTAALALYARARGLTWVVPTTVLAVAGAAYFASWLLARPAFGPMERVPASVLGALAVAVVAAPGWHRVDDEVEGSVPRPRRRTELLLTLALVTAAAGLAVIAVPDHPSMRGGAELARNILGLSGLALVAGAVLGARLAWVLPFAWAAGSYFAVTRAYAEQPGHAWVGWLMFPATYPATWVVAGGLLTAGLAAYAWGGFVPLPRRHPRR